MIAHAFDGQMHGAKVFDAGPGDITLAWDHHLPTKRVIHAAVNTVELGDQKAFTRTVTSSLVVADKEAKELRMMAQSFVKQIQQAGKEIKAPPSYGWYKAGSKLGFRVGTNVFWQDGSVQQVRTTGDDISPVAPMGSLDVWKSVAARALEAGHIETEVIMAGAFVAPLFHFSHVEGAILSAVSLLSGTGKTTAMRLGASVWANPLPFMFSLSDTPNSI